jgi:hypothetical protein
MARLVLSPHPSMGVMNVHLVKKWLVRVHLVKMLLKKTLIHEWMDPW